MYFVDRKLIEKRLRYMEELLEHFPVAVNKNDFISIRAAERMGHMLVEVMMDVGNQMIDGFIMRDPGSFEDIVAILVDEKVILPAEGEQIEALLPLRKDLLQNYTSYTYKQLVDRYMANLEAVQRYPARIRHYLTNELGPVSAFLPETEEGEK